MVNDLFCAFQPKRLMVPSLPLWLKAPLMPTLIPWLALLVSRVESSIFSIKPAPNVGVGMRKMRLLVACARAKLGWGRLQVPASLRPVMVKRSSTPPLGLAVFGLPLASKKNGNRASRTGPVEVIKLGMLLWAPSALASVTCGLVAGAVPPVAGWAWQNAQLLELNRGPSPMPFSPAIVPETESTSWKRSRPSLKKFRMSHDTVGNPGGAPAHWPALTEASEPPAPA